MFIETTSTNDRHPAALEKTKEVASTVELPRPDTPPDVWYYEGYHINLSPRYNSPAYDPHDLVPIEKPEPFLNPIQFMERYHNNQSHAHGKFHASYQGRTLAKRFRKLLRKKPHDLETVYSEITTQNDDQSLSRLVHHVVVPFDEIYNSSYSFV